MMLELGLQFLTKKIKKSIINNFDHFFSITTKLPKSAKCTWVGFFKTFYTDFPETFCSAFNTKIQLIDSNPYRNRRAQSKTRQKCAKVGFCNPPQSHSSRVQNSQMPNHLLLEADRFQQFPPSSPPPPWTSLFQQCNLQKGEGINLPKDQNLQSFIRNVVNSKSFLFSGGLTEKNGNQVKQAKNPI